MDEHLMEALTDAIRKVVADGEAVVADVARSYEALEEVGEQLAEVYRNWVRQRPAFLATAKSMLAAAPELQGLKGDTYEIRRHKLFPDPKASLDDRRRTNFTEQVMARVGETARSSELVGQLIRSFWADAR